MRFILQFGFLMMALPLLAGNPIVFKENIHQYPPNVLYKADILGGSVFLEKGGLTYKFSRQKDSTGTKSLYKFGSSPHKKVGGTKLVHSYKVVFADANQNCNVFAENAIDGYENYFKGNDPTKWSTGVKTYQKVIYQNLWDGIDLVVYQRDSMLKYDFVVNPHADEKKIKLIYQGVDSIKLHNNDVVLKTSVNYVTERKPQSFQPTNNHNDTVQTFYMIDNDEKSISFRVYKYDKTKTLIIDPELIFSTYSGSTADNWGFTATFDNEGNVYSGGVVNDEGYPVSTGAYQQNYSGGWDIGIIKYDPTGTQRLYATYLGGSGCELPHSMVVNSQDQLVLYGTTGSVDFPIKGGFDRTFIGGTYVSYDGSLSFVSGSDLFSAILSPDGTNLVASTFIGGSANDGLNYRGNEDWDQLMNGNDSLYFNYGDDARGEVIVDKDDNIYIGTCTFSTDFPIKGGFQSQNNGKEEGVIMKLSPDLSSLTWSSYMGGEEDDAIYSVDIDKQGNVYVAGGTNSPTFPTTLTSLHPAFLGGSADGFVAKISSDGTQLLHSTYYGSDSYDQIYFVRVDKNNKVYSYGQTKASGSTLDYNALYGTPNSGQFVAKMSQNLDTLVWSTTFGTGNNYPNIAPTAMSVDVCNRIYLAGVGRDWPADPVFNYDPSSGFYIGWFDWSQVKGTTGMDITADAYQKNTDGKDFYFMVLDENATTLEYATFFGEIYDGSPEYYDQYTRQTFQPGCFASGRDHVDGGTSRFNKIGTIYQAACASCGGCESYPTYPANVWSHKNNSDNCNNAVTVFNIHHDQIMANFKPTINPCNPHIVSFQNTSVVVDSLHVAFTWNFGDGSPTSNLANPTHTFTKAGTYKITLKEVDLTSCNLVDSVSFTVVITDYSNVVTLPGLSICKGDSIAVGINPLTGDSVSYKWVSPSNMTNDTVSNPYAKPDSTSDYVLNVKQKQCITTYHQKVTVYNDTMNISIKTMSTAGGMKACFGETVQLQLTADQPLRSVVWATDRKFIHILSPSTDSTVPILATHDTTIYVKAVSRYCGKQKIDSVVITVIHPQITPSNDTLICLGTTAHVSVTNNTPAIPMGYDWEPSQYVVTGQRSASATVKPDASTYFTVTGTTRQGCTTSAQIKIDVDNLAFDTTGTSEISCHNMNDGKIVIFPNGIPGYLYKWSNGGNTNTKANLSAGTYSVTVSDSYGCVNNETFVMTNPDLLTLKVTAHDISCKNVCNGIVSASVGGGTQPYSYAWNDEDSVATLRNMCMGTYTVSVTDSHSCFLSKTATIGLTVQLPVLGAYADKSILYRSQSTQLHATKNPADSVSYQWFPPDDLSNPKSATTNAKPDSTFMYTVVATDQFGCSAIDTITISVRDFVCDVPYVYVPNAFTPNGDKINDTLFLESKVVQSFTLSIYNRWGEQVFETNDINKGWDGTYKGSKLSPSVFVYYLEATCINNKFIRKKGNISLLR